MMKRQRGAALITALIFMVMLTVVALSTMHSSTFEVKIAKSVKSQVDAMNAAEDALSSGEAIVDGLSDISALSSGSGFYQGASLANLSSLDDLLGRSASTAIVSTGSGRFYVEYLGPIIAAGSSATFGSTGLGTRHLYRITGVGNKAKVTQSYFATTE